MSSEIVQQLTPEGAELSRNRADETREATHGESSNAADFKPLANLKGLFWDVARRIRLDLGKDEAERQCFVRFLATANESSTRPCLRVERQFRRSLCLDETSKFCNSWK